MLFLLDDVPQLFSIGFVKNLLPKMFFFFGGGGWVCVCGGGGEGVKVVKSRVFVSLFCQNCNFHLFWLKPFNYLVIIQSSPPESWCSSGDDAKK